MSVLSNSLALGPLAIAGLAGLGSVQSRDLRLGQPTAHLGLDPAEYGLGLAQGPLGRGNVAASNGGRQQALGPHDSLGPCLDGHALFGSARPDLPEADGDEHGQQQ